MSDTTDRQATSLQMTDRGFAPTNFEEAFRFSEMIAKSGIAPQGDTPAKVMAKLQAGAELGIPPMQALATIVPVNGRVSLMGTAALALLRRSTTCEYLRIEIEGEGDELAAVVRFKRRDDGTPGIVRYTAENARRAGLWGKRGPWVEHPEDMLTWKAVARCAKRNFSDVLMGMEIHEEARDFNLPTPVRAQVVGETTTPSDPDPALAIAATSTVVEPLIDAEVVEADAEEPPPPTDADNPDPAIAGESPTPKKPAAKAKAKAKAKARAKAKAKAKADEPISTEPGSTWPLTCPHCSLQQPCSDTSAGHACTGCGAEFTTSEAIDAENDR